MFANNDFILAITPSLAMLVLALLLLIAWLVQRSQRFLLWQSGAYSLAALPLGLQSLLPLEELNRYALFIAASIF